ncbi:MAG: TIGR03086 family protein [Geodermatophilaceae bacterium]|nr:TIGR03086 family protein [Geodermatophilaceae bacterium]
MHEHSLMVLAAAPTVAVVRGIGADQLGASTPCSDYAVQRLISHLLLWGPSLEGAARKKLVAPPADSDQDVDLTDGDWRGKLEAQTNNLVTAWSEPDAWEGTTRMGGPMELPAPMIGGMVLGELVVHGWDLARATGQQPTWHDEVLTLLYQEVAKTAEQGRDMGVYGERVQVPDTASVLDRILGLTGRNPNWTP